MAMNWPRWIKREWHLAAQEAVNASIAAGSAPPVLEMPPSPLREPSYEDIAAVFEHYRSAAHIANRYPEITVNRNDSAAYNMARVVWLASELGSDSPVVSGWRLSSARRRAFERFNFTLVPLGRSAGLAVRASRAVHGDAAWNIVRVKWLEGQVGHLIAAAAVNVAAAPRTVAEAAVNNAVGPAVVLDWTALTYGIEIETIRPRDISMIEFARRLTEAGVPCVAEGYNHSIRNHWKIVTDGSLSDRHGIGMELVSPILKGTADFEAVKTVSQILSAGGCKINKTCGLHVHVGLPRREHKLPINVLRIYGHYEPVIDTLMPPSRRGNANSYARPTNFNSRIEAAGTLEMLRSSYGYDRYRKVNLESIWRHQSTGGTIEYRQHAGTIEAEKIIEWATLVLKLTAVANSAPPLPEGPATLEGLMGLIGASDVSTAFWTRRQALLEGLERRRLARAA